MIFLGQTWVTVVVGVGGILAGMIGALAAPAKELVAADV
jgi:hypothetical protein